MLKLLNMVSKKLCFVRPLILFYFFIFLSKKFPHLFVFCMFSICLFETSKHFPKSLPTFFFKWNLPKTFCFKCGPYQKHLSILYYIKNIFKYLYIYKNKKIKNHFSEPLKKYLLLLC